MTMTKRERERVLSIVETAVVVGLALVAAWRLDVDIDKIASISADQWILIATGVGGVVVAIRNALRESVRRGAPVPVVERETPVPRRPEEGSADPEAMAYVLLWTLGAGIALAHTLSGCSPSALRVHAGVAHVVGTTFDVACLDVAADRAEALDACITPEATRESASACVAEARAHFAPRVAACAIARETHDGWADALVLAASGAPFELADGVAYASRAVRVWETLAGLGLLPGPPPDLAALATIGGAP